MRFFSAEMSLPKLKVFAFHSYFYLQTKRRTSTVAPWRVRSCASVSRAPLSVSNDMGRSGGEAGERSDAKGTRDDGAHPVTARACALQSRTVRSSDTTKH